MAASLSNLSTTPSQLFSPSQPKPFNKPPKSSPFTTKCCSQPPQQITTRRASLGLATAAALLTQIPPLHAEEPENNGFWNSGPLPTPTVTNKELANEETGTRSFLKKGIYIADIGPFGSTLRLKHYAFDLLALEDLIGKDALNYFRRYLCLKSTFMYYDFDTVISAAPEEEKKPLLQLANRLFDSVEKLLDAAKQKSDPLVRSCYDETEVVLKEVMARMTA